MIRAAALPPVIALTFVMMQAPIAAQDHTRVAFVKAMKQLVTAAGSRQESFPGMWGAQTSDDHSGDTTYKLKIFIPIFAECTLHNDSHVSPYVTCETNENEDTATVKRRFDEMVSDVAPLLMKHDPRLHDSWQGAIGCRHPGCLHAGTVYGSEMVLENNRTSISLEIGNW